MPKTRPGSQGARDFVAAGDALGHHGTRRPIHAVRDVADAVSLERGIPCSAVQSLFMTVDPKVLPKLFADCREIANSPKVAARSPRRAGDFSAGAARMIETFGFVMELATVRAKPPRRSSCGRSRGEVSVRAGLNHRRRRFASGQSRAQALSRHPVRMIQVAAVRATAKNTSVIEKLMATGISALPKKLQRKPLIR